jgi:hypothetical protein
METGILIRWGMPRQGREKEALALFRKNNEFFRSLVKDGKLTYCEPFMLASGDAEVEAGFFILKGEVTHVFELLENQEFRDLMAKGSVLTEHFRFDMLAVGESIKRTLGEYERALTATKV